MRSQWIRGWFVEQLPICEQYPDRASRRLYWFAYDDDCNVVAEARTRAEMEARLADMDASILADLGVA